MGTHTADEQHCKVFHREYRRISSFLYAIGKGHQIIIINYAVILFLWCDSKMDGKETSPLKTQPEGQVPLAEELPSTEKKTKPEIDPRRVAVEKRLADHKKSERGETKRIEPEQPISKSNSVSPESTLIWMVQIISLVSLLVSLFSI